MGETETISFVKINMLNWNVIVSLSPMSYACI